MALTHLETSINLDETWIVLDPTQKHVVVVCGTSHVHKLAGIYGECGVHITMVAAFVSDGAALPRVFVFQEKSVTHQMARATHNFDPNNAAFSSRAAFLFLCCSSFSVISLLFIYSAALNSSIHCAKVMC